MKRAFFLQNGVQESKHGSPKEVTDAWQPIYKQTFFEMYFQF